MNKTFTWRLLTPGELTDVYLQEMRRDFPAGELKPLSMILTSEAEGLAHTWGVFDGETLARLPAHGAPGGQCHPASWTILPWCPPTARRPWRKAAAALPSTKAGAQPSSLRPKCPKRLRTRPWPCAAWAFTPGAVPATPVTMSTCLTRGSASWCCPAPGAPELSDKDALDALVSCYKRTISESQWRKYVQFYPRRGACACKGDPGAGMQR